MKEYVKPEVEMVSFASEPVTDATTGGTSGVGTEIIP